MDIVKELAYILNTKRYKDITFYLDTVPILTISFDKDRKITVFVNNMKELRGYNVTFDGGVDTFIMDVDNIVMSTGVDELIRNSKDSKVSFRSEPFLYGEVSKDGIVIERDVEDYNDENEPVMIHKKYEIKFDAEPLDLTMSRIAGAFAYLQYM